MNPVEFKGQNIVMGKDQPEYLPLPAFKDKEGQVLTCWKPTNFREWWKMVRGGRVYIILLTFNQPLQPMRVMAENPMVFEKQPEEPTQRGGYNCRHEVRPVEKLKAPAVFTPRALWRWVLRFFQ